MLLPARLAMVRLFLSELNPMVQTSDAPGNVLLLLLKALLRERITSLLALALVLSIGTLPYTRVCPLVTLRRRAALQSTRCRVEWNPFTTVSPTQTVLPAVPTLCIVVSSLLSPLRNVRMLVLLPLSIPRLAVVGSTIRELARCPPNLLKSPGLAVALLPKNALRNPQETVPIPTVARAVCRLPRPEWARRTK